MLRKRFVRNGIAIAIALVSGVIGLSGFSTARAAASSRVIIAEDITAQSNRTRLLTRNSGQQEVTVDSSCPAGTVITTRIVTEQYARSQHVPFVVLPSRNADENTVNAARRQIGRLLDDKTAATLGAAIQSDALQSQSTISPASIPCGSTSTVGGSQNVGFNGPATVKGSVNYYKDPSCGYVTLNQAYAQVTGPAGAHVYWQFSAYAAGHWSWPCDNAFWNQYPVVGSAGTSQGIRSTHNAGYRFQEQFCADDRCLLNWTRVNYVILN